MTTEIALVLGILLVSLVLFITEKLRMDVVALLVLGVLAITGLVTPEEAFSGFSNPAVITVWAMFIISAALTNTNVANIIGKRVLHLSGKNDVQRIIVIMLISGVLSAFMNNIGVAALMLPIVLNISRKTGMSPSRVLMPMAFGTLLGGLTTLIGTPPNLLVSAFLRENDLKPFNLFDFSPVGVVVMLGGIAFMAFIGRHWLPKRDPLKETTAGRQKNLIDQYALHDRTFVLNIPVGSVFEGKTMAEARLGSAAGLSVFAIMRSGQPNLAPEAHTMLKANDRLLVGGSEERFRQLQRWQDIISNEAEFAMETWSMAQTELAELAIPPGSPICGQTISELDFRNTYGLDVLAVKANSGISHGNLADTRLQETDRLLVHGKQKRIEALHSTEGFTASDSASWDSLAEAYGISEGVIALRVPEESFLTGSTLAESRIRDGLGLHVLTILREGDTFMPDADEQLRADDLLIINCEQTDLDILLGFHELEVVREATPDLSTLKSEEICLVEVVLLPRAAQAGKTPRQMHFRAKYGLQVIAIWREGRAYRSNLRDMEVSFGDALLLLGRREKLKMLSQEEDFLVISEEMADTKPPKAHKAPLAALILLAMLAPVLLGYMPISIAAVAGATLMILTGCLKMEEAYRAIDWRCVFLIAGMLPLGIAMQTSGTANLLAENIVGLADLTGPFGVLIGLYLVTALATSIIPTAALVVLMAPIALKAAVDLNVSPHAMLMAIAIAASASFTSPISHPANVLVMGPGGYRFMDYVKLGIPLTLVVMVLALLMLSIVWPM